MDDVSGGTCTWIEPVGLRLRLDTSGLVCRPGTLTIVVGSHALYNWSYHEL